MYTLTLITKYIERTYRSFVPTEKKFTIMYHAIIRTPHVNFQGVIQWSQKPGPILIMGVHGKTAMK